MRLGADIDFAGPGCQREVERLAGCQSLREGAEVETATWILHQLSMLTVASDVGEPFKFSESETLVMS